jgi:predicted homoserine dehydrogenase-like protein
VDVVLEATGDPEGAARTASLAIEAGRHVVMATKEAEVVVGPILAHRAAARGVVHTPVDGDQPSLLIGLVGWARSLGFGIVCAGKASESDFVWDGAGDRVTAWERSEASPGLAAAFRLDEQAPETSLATRARAPFARTTVPDLCEMGIVANHTGLAPDRPELHAPIARTIELPTLFRPKAAGGLLAGVGRVDMFNCLRRPDELSFAGGVFVVVEAPDAATGRLLRAKGLPTCPQGRYVLVHNPVHLLGAEALASVLLAGSLGCSTGGVAPRQRFDLVGRASRDLEPGERLTIGTRHAIDGLDHRLEPARALAPKAAVPYYLADGATVRRPVRRGACPTMDDLELRSDSVLQRLRIEQDRELGAG